MGNWAHWGDMTTLSECTVLNLHVNTFTDIASRCQVTRGPEHAVALYARDFVWWLNNLSQQELTDLDTPQINVKMLARKAFPRDTTSSSVDPIALASGLTRGLTRQLNRTFTGFRSPTRGF